MVGFDKFTSEVYHEYISKKEKAILSSRMEDPTPANLRDFAMLCLKQELSAEDKNIFQEFFDPETSYENLEKAIRKTDLGKMKSVQNYLLGSTKEPSEIIVKLSAILTDFQPRPYHKWRAKSLEKGETEISESNNQNYISVESTVEQPDIQEKNNKLENLTNTNKVSIFSWFNKNTIASLLGVITVFPVGFITYNQFKNNDCAYWNGEKYITVDCGERTIAQEIIHVKDKSLLSLKKISQPDTLTDKDAKKIWYSKINNKVEFFTGPGYHPVNRDKALKAATIYIIKKYGIVDSSDFNKNLTER
jgi:hypothetical protein